jgi:hypothetical protein
MDRYRAGMRDLAERAPSRGERVQRALMIWAALILFVLGLLLLMAPS